MPTCSGVSTVIVLFAATAAANHQHSSCQLLSSCRHAAGSPYLSGTATAANLAAPIRSGMSGAGESAARHHSGLPTWGRCAWLNGSLPLHQGCPPASKAPSSQLSPSQLGTTGHIILHVIVNEAMHVITLLAAAACTRCL